MGTNAPDFLDSLKSKGLLVEPRGANLRVSGNLAVLSGTDRDYLLSHKAELLATLTGSSTATQTRQVGPEPPRITKIRGSRATESPPPAQLVRVIGVPPLVANSKPAATPQKAAVRPRNAASRAKDPRTGRFTADTNPPSPLTPPSAARAAPARDTQLPRPGLVARFLFGPFDNREEAASHDAPAPAEKSGGGLGELISKVLGF